MQTGTKVGAYGLWRADAVQGRLQCQGNWNLLHSLNAGQLKELRSWPSNSFNR